MNPDMWHFSSSEKGKKFFKSYATYPPVAIGVSIILLTNRAETEKIMKG